MGAGSNLLRDNSELRYSFSSHFPRLHGDPAKVRNDTKSHVVPKAEQTEPVLTDRGRPGRAKPPGRAEPRPTTELYPPHPPGHMQLPDPPCPQGCSLLLLKLHWMLLDLSQLVLFSCLLLPRHFPLLGGYRLSWSHL